MKTIGIDLGTTNSCVYFLDEAGNPELVVDDKGNGIFPSAVWSAGIGKDRVVGHRAKSRMGNQPSPVIAVKRKMGTDQKVMLGGELVGPVEVSAEILRHCRNLVEAATKDTVGTVVVTVPAYFDAAPMRDTQLAALQAFFDGDEKRAKGHLELQLEPEAAAFAYLAEDPAKRLLVLVYDLGGGTFDVTVLEKTPEAGLASIAFGGDPHLGGDNIDDRLASWFSYRIRGGRAEALPRILAPGRYDDDTRYTVLQQLLANDVAGLRGVLRPEDRDLLIPNPPRYDLDLDASVPEDLVRIQKLKLLAENAKKQLTLTSEVAITQQGAFEDHAGDLVDVDMDLSLKEFNLLIGDMMEKTVRATLAVVEKSRKECTDFDRVLLVGGSSRMRVVMEELSKLFTCPVNLADPDKIVARGAAMRARGMRGEGLPPEEGLSLDYPRQTADTRVNIAGRLANAIEDGRAYLIAIGGERDRELQDVAVQGDRFLLQKVELQPGGENRFRVEVEDSQEKRIAVAEFSILQGGVDSGPTVPKLTKPIRSLGRKGFKELFPEGEPLPATKTESCFRADEDDFVVIPIHQGERLLRDLRIDGLGPEVKVGAEIKVTITIERDYSVRCEAVVCETGQKVAVDFRIEAIPMPSLEELDRDKDCALDEIENGLAIVKDKNMLAQFRRSVRRLEGEYNKARRSNEPDAHHLFTLVGELRKIKAEVDNCQVFLTPPLEEFQGLMRVCRNMAAKLKPNAAVSKDEILEKITALERAGKDAWDTQDAREWEYVNNEGRELRQGLKYPDDEGSDIRKVAPEVIQRSILAWLDELADQVKQRRLEAEFGEEIEALRTQVRAVDLRDADAAREKLVEIVQEKIAPLEERMKKAGVKSVRRGLTEWQR